MFLQIMNNIQNEVQDNQQKEYNLNTKQWLSDIISGTVLELLGQLASIRQL